MAGKTTVDHVGVVKSVTPQYVDVEILNKSMCAACHAKGMCSMSDVSVKMIRVNNYFGQTYSEGEQVRVVMRKTLGLKAVWISYVFPLIILMILLLSLPKFGVSELNVGLFAVAGVVIYYGCIWLLKDKIAREFTFTIEKQQ